MISKFGPNYRDWNRWSANNINQKHTLCQQKRQDPGVLELNKQLLSRPLYYNWLTELGVMLKEESDYKRNKQVQAYFRTTEAGPRLWCNLSWSCMYAKPLNAPWRSLTIKNLLRLISCSCSKGFQDFCSLDNFSLLSFA